MCHNIIEPAWDSQNNIGKIKYKRVNYKTDL